MRGAAPIDTTGQEKTLPLKLSQNNIQYNLKTIHKGRIYISILSGLCAGILGLTSFHGLFLYLFISIIYYLCAISLSNYKEYFLSINAIIFGNFSQALLSFVLFWTIIYDIVHIF